MGVPVVARSYQSKLGWPEGKQNLLAISHPVATIGSAQHPATGSDQLATDLRSEVVIWGIRRQRQALECGNIALRIPVVVRLSHAEATPKAPTLLDCKCKCNEPVRPHNGSHYRSNMEVPSSEHEHDLDLDLDLDLVARPCYAARVFLESNSAAIPTATGACWEITGEPTMH
ncbi:hypothetical protein H634G_00072 [Metarhizium anisopliae BRIP 53293]|uniref:Uncharacterized protein n=1 Tax=Metarhizium anisopliae BRIP 53293 TaxID=1291518 RepID=A0A0D9PET0_METAN|nr:hypothetical protein H634G_00072 [Metarhizium anisopliae BRIP 53293]KJK92308.1 hypothetical protein H633G_03856 [Metarhizium anisopliae BRIP 53284]